MPSSPDVLGRLGLHSPLLSIEASEFPLFGNPYGLLPLLAEDKYSGCC